MSEEERTEKRKPRTISHIALMYGIVAVLLGFLIVPYAFRDAIVYSDGPGVEVIEIFLIVAMFAMISFWPTAVIGLVLSIVTLFIERKLLFRLLPLAFVVAGILLYAVCSVRLWFTLDLLRM